MSFIYKLWNNSSGDESCQPEEIINKLFVRLQTSTILQDRRDSLKSLSTLIVPHSERLREDHIGVLVDLMVQERDNDELVMLCLHILMGVMRRGGHLAAVASKVILYSGLIPTMDLLSNGDKNARRCALDALNMLVGDSELGPRMFSQSSSVFSVLTELLEDKWDYIRCAALELLLGLTGDGDIDKVVVFNNGYSRALNIIRLEGFPAVSGQPVEQSFQLITNLMRRDTPNKTSFLEGNCLRDLISFMSSLNDLDHSLLLLLGVVDEIVHHSNTTRTLRGFQAAIAKSGLLKAMADLAFRPDLPPHLLAPTLSSLSATVRGCPCAQEVLQSSFLPHSGKLFPATVISWALDSDRPLYARSALTNLLRAYLQNNSPAKEAIIRTFLPASTVKNASSTGRMLCGGLLSSDSTSVFLSADLILNCLLGMPQLKEDLLRVQLSTSPHLPPSLLIHHCADILMKDLSLFVTGGMVMLLSAWVAHSPLSALFVLRMTSFMNLLVALVCSGPVDSPKTGMSSVLLALLYIHNDDSVPHFTRNNISDFIEAGCGSFDCFVDRILLFCRSELFLSCSRSPDLTVQPGSLSLDPHLIDIVNFVVVTLRSPDLAQQVDKLTSRISQVEAQLQSTRDDLESWQSAFYARQDQFTRLSASYDSLKAEHDDLLIFLADREMSK